MSSDWKWLKNTSIQKLINTCLKTVHRIGDWSFQWIFPVTTQKFSIIVELDRWFKCCTYLKNISEELPDFPDIRRILELVGRGLFQKLVQVVLINDLVHVGQVLVAGGVGCHRGDLERHCYSFGTPFARSRHNSIWVRRTCQTSRALSCLLMIICIVPTVQANFLPNLPQDSDLS